MQEVELDHAFAETLGASEEFQKWILSTSRFARFAEGARLLMGEQQSARKNARHWWKHWWSYMPDGSSSETDVFAVFEHGEGNRFALHFENKPPHGILKMAQAAGYRRRAAFWANTARFLNYADFETILLAPASFIAAHKDCASQFDRCLAYEEVRDWVPAFALTGSQKN